MNIDDGVVDWFDKTRTIITICYAAMMIVKQ